MDHRIEFVLAENRTQGLLVAGIDLLERNVDTRDAAHAFDGRRIRIGEVVDDDDAEAGADELDGRMGADVAGTPEINTVSFFILYNGIFCLTVRCDEFPGMQVRPSRNRSIARRDGTA